MCSNLGYGADTCQYQREVRTGMDHGITLMQIFTTMNGEIIVISLGRQTTLPMPRA